MRYETEEVGVGTWRLADFHKVKELCICNLCPKLCFCLNLHPVVLVLTLSPQYINLL